MTPTWPFLNQRVWSMLPTHRINEPTKGPTNKRFPASPTNCSEDPQLPFIHKNLDTDAIPNQYFISIQDGVSQAPFRELLEQEMHRSHSFVCGNISPHSQDIFLQAAIADPNLKLPWKVQEGNTIRFKESHYRSKSWTRTSNTAALCSEATSFC